MNIIFEQLWNGSIAPCKNCGAGDPEVEKIAELAERNWESLSALLGEQQKKTLQSFKACCDEYCYLVTVLVFREGFSLASRLLTDALGERG